MNRACTVATLALTLAGGLVSSAARPADPPQRSAPAILEAAPRGTVVFDDDGGRAQIVPRQAVPGRDATYHGGPVVPRGTVQAVFLGSAWREKANRAQESKLMDALRQAGRAEAAAALERYGIQAWESPGLALEDPVGDPVQGRSISDLEIQKRLDNLLGGSPIDANAVYVVFLAPGLGSSLGAKTSEKDFAAYHNHFHSAAGVVHYVVVPYDAERARWLANAHQSLTQTLINPEGNGWY